MTGGAPLRVLVVDDTVVYRKIVSDILGEVPEVQVIGSAHNGKAALVKVAAQKPDLMILDIEMPEMTGLEVLERLQAEQSDVGAIMLSTLTRQGGATTVQALQLGAFDFITKPQHATIAENAAAIKNALAPMLRAFARQQAVRRSLKPRPVGSSRQAASPPRDAHPRPRATMPIVAPRQKPDIIAIGVSTGGPRALSVVLPALPADLGVPILVVQHMPPMFTRSLAESLRGQCALDVKEAEDREVIKANTVYIAPGGQQMAVAADGGGRSRRIRVNDDPPENSCKPSVDYLFRSVASHYLGRAIGVVLTGMGADGAASTQRLKQNGATIVAQDEATCVVFGMPKAVIEAGMADIVAPLPRIADEIIRLVRSS